MSNRVGYLTIFSPSRTEIYGEFADAEWATKMANGESNNVFIGTASEGTLEKFLQLDRAAVSHVAYSFDSEGQTFSGSAELLAPIPNKLPGEAQIQIETGDTPVPL